MPSAASLRWLQGQPSHLSGMASMACWCRQARCPRVCACMTVCSARPTQPPSHPKLCQLWPTCSQLPNHRACQRHQPGCIAQARLAEQVAGAAFDGPALPACRRHLAGVVHAQAAVDKGCAAGVLHARQRARAQRPVGGVGAADGFTCGQRRTRQEAGVFQARCLMGIKAGKAMTAARVVRQAESSRVCGAGQRSVLPKEVLLPNLKKLTCKSDAGVGQRNPSHCRASVAGQAPCSSGRSAGNGVSPLWQQQVQTRKQRGGLSRPGASWLKHQHGGTRAP